jgi:ABC-type multidrug transport system ATPase subunit
MLLKILAGLRRADRGRIEMVGLSRADDSPLGWARRIAYVGREPAIYPWLTAGEALRMTASLLQLDRGEGRRRVTEAIEYWQLGDGLDKPMRRNGEAYRQRAGMAAALLGRAEVVLLDEPLRAVQVAERIRLLRLPEPRCTVILASQHPSTEAGIVNQLVLLRGGRIALHVPIAALEQRGLPMTMRGIGLLGDELGEPMPKASPGQSLADRTRASA